MMRRRFNYIMIWAQSAMAGWQLSNHNDWLAAISAGFVVFHVYQYISLVHEGDVP